MVFVDSLKTANRILSLAKKGGGINHTNKKYIFLFEDKLTLLVDRRTMLVYGSVCIRPYGLIR